MPLGSRSAPAIALLSSRVPFDLGLAIALGSIALAQRGHDGWALALALLSSLASPVAGAFLALAFIAWALAGSRRALAGALALAALVPIGLLTLAFPEGGTQPFVASAFYPALAAVLVVGALMPREQRVLRVGALLYAAALIGAYALPTAVGGNADRLGALAAGPLAACTLASAVPRWRRLALALLAPALLYWQVNAPVTDFVASESSAAVNASYYSPLLRELRALGVGNAARPVRIEAVATAAHWEARFLAPHVMLARGWERQLDRYRNALFYESAPAPTAQQYAVWLRKQGVSFVALPDAPLDYSARAEAQLVRGGAAVPARSVAVCSLAPVRGRARERARGAQRRAHAREQRFVRPARAARGQLHRADPLHPPVDARNWSRLRCARPVRGLDRAAGARAGQL